MKDNSNFHYMKANCLNQVLKHNKQEGDTSVGEDAKNVAKARSSNPDQIWIETTQQMKKNLLINQIHALMTSSSMTLQQ